MYKKSGAKDSITLNYKIPEGQSVVVTSKVVSKFDSEQMGQTISVDMNSSTVLGHKLLSVDADNNMTVELDFIDLTQSMESPMGSGDTDYSELIGKKAEFTLSGEGEATEKKGFSKLPEITNINGESLKGEMYELVVDATFFKLPDHPVKVGDSWTNEDSSEMPYGGGNLKTESKTIYIITEKLVVDGEDCFKIDITGTSTTGGEFEQNGTQLAMERSSTSSGHLIFAYNKGMYLSMDVSSKTEGIIDVPAAGMKIPQTITSTTSTTVAFE